MIKKNTKLKVAFLLDEKNNWLQRFIFEDKILKRNVNLSIEYSHNPLDIEDNDIVFILGFTKILDASFLRKNHLNLVIHNSPLPKGKGFAPLQWQVLEGINNVSICMIEATEEVDSGDIILTDTVRLNGDELYPEIRSKQAESILSLINRFINNYPNFSRTPQKGESTFYRKRTLNDSQLNIDKSIREQFNLLRVCNNDLWPAFFILNNHKYILKIEKCDD